MFTLIVSAPALTRATDELQPPATLSLNVPPKLLAEINRAEDEAQDIEAQGGSLKYIALNAEAICAFAPEEHQALSAHLEANRDTALYIDDQRLALLPGNTGPQNHCPLLTHESAVHIVPGLVRLSAVTQQGQVLRSEWVNIQLLLEAYWQLTN